MTSYPGCVTPTEIDPEGVTPTEIDPDSNNWAEKSICGPSVHPFTMRRTGSEASEQTFYGLNTVLKVTKKITSAQTFYGSSTVLKIERVG